MCGITGFFHSDGIAPDSQLLPSMAQALNHRGPDHQGLWQDACCGLASCRLAIIDPAGGNQPMCHPETGHVLVLNGAIYNYQELRAELANLGHAFRSNSDTETLLAAWAQWGQNCLHRLNGMFAFALWEPFTRTLTLVRDRLGKKPLFYATVPGGGLYFASEIKALLRVPGMLRQMNVLAMDRMLDFGFNLAPDTFFEGIQQVMPGTILRANVQGATPQAYWTLPTQAEDAPFSEAEAVDGLRWHLEEAVRARLVADVPVAAYLSGGIDSSSVTSLYSRMAGQPVQTLSISFEDAGYDERHFARMVAEACGARHHEFLCSIAPEDVGNLIWHLETPLATLLHLPLYLLSRQLRDMGFKVALCGDGADEILGGYDYFKLVKLMAFIGRGAGSGRANLLRRVFPVLASPEQARSQYEMLATFPAVHPAFPYRFQAFQFKAQLLSDTFLDRLQLCRAERRDTLPTPPAAKSLLNQALYFEAAMRLPNLTLPLADTMSMAHGVELRSPFLDHRLVEFVFSLPGKYKMHGLNEKSLLKKAARSFLPPQISQRRKQPLAPPGKGFVRTFRSLFGDVLSPAAVRDKGYFRPEFIAHMLREFDQASPLDYSGVLIVAFFTHLFDDLFFQNPQPNLL